MTTGTAGRVHLDSGVVGTAVGPRSWPITTRAVMAFAAGLGDGPDWYFDTGTRPDVVAHPLFPTAVEWQAVMAAPGVTLPGLDVLVGHDRVVGVHYDHLIEFHQPVRAGIDVSLTATLVALEQRRSGALHVTRFEALDGAGAPVWTTWQGTLLRGVAVRGQVGERRDIGLPPIASGAPLERVSLEVGRRFPHVYTECSGIWNPIHTDEVSARAAGLPGIILHGSATLALAVSRVLAHCGDARPELVRRIHGRFEASVPVPNVLTVAVLEDVRRRDTRVVRFEVLDAAGVRALADGMVELADPGP